MALRIVVLDGYTLNPGDLDWSPLEAVGQVTVHDRTRPDDLVDRLGDCQIALTNKAVIQAQHIDALPNLKYIGVLATGFNVVDVKAARAKGIPVCNVPGYSTDSVAQQVFALLLALVNRVDDHARAVRAGDWAGCRDFSFTLGTIHELAGKTLGIVGLGAIGQQVARIGAAFGMTILAGQRVGENSPATSIEVAPGCTAQRVPLNMLFQTADVVSLHCPLTDDTKHLVNAGRLASMKRSAILINTGRGPLVEEAALAEALKQGTIAAAGLDVLSTEPPSVDNPLPNAPNCLITPHVAWATLEARKRLLHAAVANVIAFLAGSPTNVVN